MTLRELLLAWFAASSGLLQGDLVLCLSLCVLSTWARCFNPFCSEPQQNCSAWGSGSLGLHSAPLQCTPHLSKGSHLRKSV